MESGHAPPWHVAPVRIPADLTAFGSINPMEADPDAVNFNRIAIYHRGAASHGFGADWR